MFWLLPQKVWNSCIYKLRNMDSTWIFQSLLIWATAQQNQQNDRSDQSLSCLHEKALGSRLPIKCTAKTQIRPVWSESLLWAQVILLVLSCSHVWGFDQSAIIIIIPKPLASLCGCAGQFESYLVASPRQIFSWRGSLWCFRLWRICYMRP